MRIDLSGPRLLDLDRGGYVVEASGGCCDLCRQESTLYRLIRTPDALCEGCFVLWHC